MAALGGHLAEFLLEEPEEQEGGASGSSSSASTPRPTTRAFDFDELEETERSRPPRVPRRPPPAPPKPVAVEAPKAPPAATPPQWPTLPFPLQCVCIGEPWVPIREFPERYSKLLGAVVPNEEVEFLQAQAGYALFHKVDKNGRGILGWSPLEQFRPVREWEVDWTAVEKICQWERRAEAQGPTAELGYGDGVFYWDKRYKEDGETFEWTGLEAEEAIKLVERVTNGTGECRILHAGCGTSLLPEQLYDSGYRQIVNIDVAPQVVHQMRQRNIGKRPGMVFRVGDCTNLNIFKDGRFDLVLDKALLDTFACCAQRGLVIGDYLSEVSRVLDDGGMLLVLSFAQASERLPFLEEAPHVDFSVEVLSAEKGCALLARKGPRPRAAWPALRKVLEEGGPPWWGNE